MNETKGCYVFYHPNGGTWGDNTTEPKPSPTKDGMLCERQPFEWPEGTESLTRPGYRKHTSQNFLNVIRFYTADGKGNGFDPEKICNGFGYDCWPSNALELTKNGHDANWFGMQGLGLKGGETVYLYMCWDPIVTYDMGNITVQDFVYITEGNEYRILGTGDKTNYSINRMDYNVEGYTGPIEIPVTDKPVKHWVDEKGNIYIPGTVHTVTEPLNLKAVY